MTNLREAGAALGKPFLTLLDNVGGALPGVIASLLVLLVGYIIGAFLGHVVKKALVKTEVMDIIVNRLGLQQEVGKLNLPVMLALITKWYVFTIFLNPAAQVVGLDSLAQFFSDAAKWIPNIILAVVIVIAGYILAEYIARRIRDVKSNRNSLLAQTAKVLTMILVLIVALSQVSINVSIAENSFLIVLAGIMLGLAIAFGFALRDEAKGLVKEIKRRI